MKGKKTIFFLILILSSNLSLAFGATNEGYGEDSTALGQFVDTFDNANNVSVAVNVINNATLGVMELNYTFGAGWWNVSWLMRQTHYIDQDDAKGVNYTVKIRVWRGNGVSSGDDMYCNLSTRNDFGDIRFVDPSTLTELGYWIKEDEYTAGSNALFFVRLDTINLTEGDKRFDIYYNNSAETTTSNIYDAVLIGDDFSYTGSINPDIWYNYTQDDGNLESTSRVNGDKLYGDLEDEVNADDSDGFIYISKYAVPDLKGWELYGEGNWAGADWLRGGGSPMFLGVNDTDDHVSGWEAGQHGDFGLRLRIWKDDVPTWISDPADDGSGNWWMLAEHNETDGTYDDWDFVFKNTVNQDGSAVAGINNPIRVQIHNYLHSWASQGRTTIDIYIDYVYLIKYSDRGQGDGNWTFTASTSGYEYNGYFTTTNYLNDTNVNGTTLALQTISTIPANTEIKVQFSNDNATWRNNLGTIGLGNILTSGLDTIEMRDLNYTVAYLRYNESTTDNTRTPYLNQSKIITTIGNSTGGSVIIGGGGLNSANLLMIIFLCTIAMILFWRFAK